MISYRLQRHRRSQSIKIRVEPSGAVVVTAPSLCPTFFVDRFVSQHENWITTQLSKMKEQRDKKRGKDSESNIISLFGKEYHKEVLFDTKSKIGVQISGQKLQVSPVSNTATSIDRSLTQFLKSTAEKYIIPRTHQLAEMMNISFGQITLRDQKTRWGSCSSTGNLNFNWRLVHAPTLVIDYVIIHELAHRREMNHSQKFWNIVATYDPEYAKHRGWLKREGMNLS